MLQVVKRLLDIVEPGYLVMGQKDFQQHSLVSCMIREFRIPTQLIVSPTKRETDGLAMSSRNARLSPDFRKKAVILHRVLLWAKQSYRAEIRTQIEEKALLEIQKAGLRPEYFSIVDHHTLLPADGKSKRPVACVAAWADNIRLIDNMFL